MAEPPPPAATGAGSRGAEPADDADRERESGPPASPAARSEPGSPVAAPFFLLYPGEGASGFAARPPPQPPRAWRTPPSPGSPLPFLLLSHPGGGAGGHRECGHRAGGRALGGPRLAPTCGWDARRAPAEVWQGGRAGSRVGRGAGRGRASGLCPERPLRSQPGHTRPLGALREWVRAGRGGRQARTLGRVGLPSETSFLFWRCGFRTECAVSATHLAVCARRECSKPIRVEKASSAPRLAPPLPLQIKPLLP